MRSISRFLVETHLLQSNPEVAKLGVLDMDKLQEKAKNALKEFENTRSKKWMPEAMLTDLVEGFGELANKQCKLQND